MTATAIVRHPVQPLPWIRDFVIVGAATGFIAPAMFLGSGNFLFPLLAGAGGAVAGLFAGWLSAHAMAGRMRRMRRYWLFPLGVLIGSAWGAVSGVTPYLGLDQVSLLGISAAVAGIAGGIQLGWFWFAYCVRRVNHRSTWPVVALACAVSSGLGFVAAHAFLALL